MDSFTYTQTTAAALRLIHASLASYKAALDKDLATPCAPYRDSAYGVYRLWAELNSTQVKANDRSTLLDLVHSIEAPKRPQGQEDGNSIRDWEPLSSWHELATAAGWAPPPSPSSPGVIPL